ncbi:MULTISPECIES: ABC transporter ATP-binding protein [Allobaculum]|uniref:ABC transporter ATP-binding protein n=1 Tax=Allobaculum TaxID=174708 RepID=UPI001E3EE640|nr:MULTISPECIES: ABC transporter ATP-binding protein [Allobaculum]UNT94565.1 ABC transporter ATP-binding protein [Allobaculum sp. Allo2]
MDSVLKITGLSKNFGGLAAVSGINMEIYPGELIGLIGPNGAGKTTLFNLLTGVYEPSEGLIELNVDGKKQQIGGMKPYKITALGMARTFQNIRLFKSMTVLENVKLAMHKNAGYGVFNGLLRTSRYYNAERWIEEKACEYLQEVGLYKKRYDKATNLPYGEQRRLEIARALATQPSILFLDEPAAGMNPQETEELTQLIHHLRDKYKLTIILIEHDMSLVMNLCERIFVLNYGQLIASGTPDEIKNNEFVIKAYLGEEV